MDASRSVIIISTTWPWNHDTSNPIPSKPHEPTQALLLHCIRSAVPFVILYHTRQRQTPIRLPSSVALRCREKHSTNHLTARPTEPNPADPKAKAVNANETVRAPFCPIRLSVIQRVGTREKAIHLPRHLPLHDKLGGWGTKKNQATVIKCQKGFLSAALREKRPPTLFLPWIHFTFPQLPFHPFVGRIRKRKATALVPGPSCLRGKSVQ